MKSQNFILCAFLILCFNCSKKRTIECVPASLKIMLRGFTVQESDTVIIREFAADTTKKDTLNTRMVVATPENLNISDYVIAELSHLSSWRVELPGAHKSYYIRNILIENKQTAITRDKNATCVNEIISAQVNSMRYGTSNIQLNKQF